MLLLTYSSEECFANFDILIIYDLFRFFNRIFQIYYILSVCNRAVKEQQKSQTCVTVKLRKSNRTQSKPFMNAVIQSVRRRQAITEYPQSHHGKEYKVFDYS